MFLILLSSHSNAEGFKLDDIELSDDMLIALKYLELVDQHKDDR